jgi:hypothetical protein
MTTHPNAYEELETRGELEEPVERRNLLALLGVLAGGGVVAACAGAEDSGETSPPAVANHALATIDAGDAGPPQSNHPTFEHAIDTYAAQPNTQVTLIIDRLINVAASRNVPTNVTLRFQDRGQIVVPSGIKVTLSGPIQAIACPRYPLFVVSSGSGGTVVPNHAGTVYYANWWSDDEGKAGQIDDSDVADVGKQWNNMVKGLVRSGAAVRARSFALAGRRQLRTTMDARSFAGSQHLDFSAARIEVSMLNGIAVNFTDSSGIRVMHLAVAGSATTASGPHVGVLVARGVGSGFGPTGDLYFQDLRISGQWRLAALYNSGSRDNVFVGGNIENGTPGSAAATGRYTAFFGRWVADEDLVDFLEQPPNPDPENPQRPIPRAQTNGPGIPVSGQVLLATKFWGKVTAATLYLRAFNDFSGINNYTNSAGPAHVYLDVSDEAMSHVSIENLYAHGSPTNGLLIDGQYEHRIANLTFSTRSFKIEDVGAQNHSVKIGVVRLSAAKFFVGSHLPFKCEPTTELYDCEIRSYAENFAVTLGRVFTGQVSLGKLQNLATGAATAPGGILEGEATASFHAASTPARSRSFSPMSLAAREGAPQAMADEAIIWLEKATGDLMVTTTAGTLPLVNFGA